jgi:pimeloyl-ACP methyl ester carboxylesterase
MDCFPQVQNALQAQARHKLTRGLAMLGICSGVLLALVVAGGWARSLGPGHVVRIRGIHLYYEVHGRGSPLLLIHGGAGNGKQFEKQLPAFARRYRCIVPDCCAQGRTSDRPGPLTYHAMAQDMVALLDRLHVTRVDVMGWSDGGNVGLDLAMHYPERVNHLVTFGANFQPDGLNAMDVAWNRTATADSFGPGMRAGWTALNPQPEHYEQAMNKIITMWRTLPNWSLGDMQRIRAKCLICAGEHDVVRPEHTAQLADAIHSAQMWIVPDASHSALIERPDLVNPRVLEFLSQ